MEAIEKARLAQLERCVPDIWEFNSYLYIGAGPYRHHFFEIMREHNLIVDVVEIEHNSCVWILKEHPWIWQVHCCDIRDFFQNIHEESVQWDCCIWSHGIETLPKGNDSALLLLMMELYVSRLIVHMTPYGKCGGAGNVSVWYPDDFVKRHYLCNTLGNRDQRNSNLLAWKRI